MTVNRGIEDKIHGKVSKVTIVEYVLKKTGRRMTANQIQGYLFNEGYSKLTMSPKTIVGQVWKSDNIRKYNDCKPVELEWVGEDGED